MNRSILPASALTFIYAVSLIFVSASTLNAQLPDDITMAREAYKRHRGLALLSEYHRNGQMVNIDYRLRLVTLAE